MIAEIMNDPDDVGVDYNPDEDEPVTPAEKAKRKFESEFRSTPGVTGIGIGLNAIGDDAVIVYVSDNSVSASLPKKVDGIEVLCEVTGDIDAY